MLVPFRRPPPPGIEALNAPYPAAPVWKGNLEEQLRGLEVLGSPLGSPQFINRILEEKLAEEQQIFETLPRLPNTQVAWLMLFFCGAPRANYILRTTPPSLTRNYATQRDDMVIACLASILNIPREYFDSSDITCQIHLPARYGV